jgi:hypothetical protein
MPGSAGRAKRMDSGWGWPHGGRVAGRDLSGPELTPPGKQLTCAPKPAIGLPLPGQPAQTLRGGSARTSVCLQKLAIAPRIGYLCNHALVGQSVLSMPGHAGPLFKEGAASEDCARFLATPITCADGQSSARRHPNRLARGWRARAQPRPETWR